MEGLIFVSNEKCGKKEEFRKLADVTEILK